MIGFALVVGFAFGMALAFVTTACLLLPALPLDFVLVGLLPGAGLLEVGALAFPAVFFTLAVAALLVALAALGCCGAFTGFFATGLAVRTAGFAAFFTDCLPAAALVADFATTFFFAVTVLLLAVAAFVAGRLRLLEAAGFLLAGAAAVLRAVLVAFFAGALTDLAWVAVLPCFTVEDLLVAFPEEAVLPDGVAAFLAGAAAFLAVAFAGLLAAFFGAGAFFFLEAIRSNSLNISLTHW